MSAVALIPQRSFLMKRNIFFSVMMVFLLASCINGESANAQSSNNEQRLIGTWVAVTGGTWIFNADGTGTGVPDDTRKSDIEKYKLFGNKLAIFFNGGSYTSTVATYDFFISNDGKTILLVGTGGWIDRVLLQKKD